MKTRYLVVSAVILTVTVSLVCGCGEETGVHEFEAEKVYVTVLSDSLVADRLSDNNDNPEASIITVKFDLKVENIRIHETLHSVGVDSVRMLGGSGPSEIGVFRFEDALSESPRVDLLPGEIVTIRVLDRSGMNDIPKCTGDQYVWCIIFISDETGYPVGYAGTGTVTLVCYF